jgi:hypothetical protein
MPERRATREEKPRISTKVREGGPRKKQVARRRRIDLFRAVKEAELGRPSSEKDKWSTGAGATQSPMADQL